jgi:hypothetical protein
MGALSLHSSSWRKIGEHLRKTCSICAKHRPCGGELIMEPMTGIEPAYSAWEADVLPLNYIGLTSWAGDHEG